MWDQIIMFLFLFAGAAHAVPYPQNSTSTSASPSSSTVVVPASITPFTSQLVNPGTTLWISGDVTVTPFVPCVMGGLQDCSRSGQPSYTFSNAYPQNVYAELENSDGFMYNLSNSQRSLLDGCGASYNDAWQGYLSTAPIVFDPSLIPASTWWNSHGATTYLESGYPNVGGYSTSWDVYSLLLETSLGASVAITTMPGYYTDSLGYKQSTDVGGYWSTFSDEEDYPNGFSTETYTITEAAINQPADIFPAYYAAYYATPFTFSTAIECCLWCTLFGGTVQVYHWPTTSVPSAVSTMATLVNAADFTFVSPSVYIAFQSLAATNICGPVGGNDSAATTLAFASDELSTAPAYVIASKSLDLPNLELSFTAATWRDATDCASITESFYQNLIYAPSTENTLPTAWFTSGSVEADFPLYTVSYNPCSPMISVPTELFSINDAWTGCVPALSAAFFDPPYILSTGNGLVAFQPSATSNTPVEVSTTSAQPQQTPTPNIPTITTAPVAPIPTSTQSPDPPATLPNSAANDPPTSTSPVAVDPPNPSSSNDPAASNLAPSPTIASNDPPTQTNPTPTGLAVISLGTTTLTANSASAFILPDSQTLTPGGQVTYSSTILSVASNGASIVIGGSITQSISQAPPIQTSLTPMGPAILTLGATTLTANSASAFILPDSQTLTPGGQVTYSSTILSLATNGASVIIGGSTTQSLAQASPTQYQIGTQTLIAGAPAVTVSGTVFSLAPGGSSVVVDGTTQAISALFSSTPEYIVAGSQTLQVGGPAITVSGTVVSLLPGGASVVVGGSTEALSQFLGASTTEVEVGIGGIIQTMGGFAVPTPSPSKSAVQYQGGNGSYNGTIFAGGARKRMNVDWLIGIMVGITGVGWVL